MSLSQKWESPTGCGEAWAGCGETRWWRREYQYITPFVAETKPFLQAGLAALWPVGRLAGMSNDQATLDELRDDVRRSSLGGFPMIATASVIWALAGVGTLLLPQYPAALIVLFQGCVSMPLGLFVLPRLLKLSPLPNTHPLLPLLIQCALVQTAALPAVILVLMLKPAYLPVAMASVVGAHFLPYAWIQRTKAYAVAGGMIPALMFALAVGLKERSFTIAPFVTSAVLLVTAITVRASALRQSRGRVTVA